jgi:hypothetical protein
MFVTSCPAIRAQTQSATGYQQLELQSRSAQRERLKLRRSIDRVKGQSMSGSVMPTLTVVLPSKIFDVWALISLDEKMDGSWESGDRG